MQRGMDIRHCEEQDNVIPNLTMHGQPNVHENERNYIKIPLNLHLQNCMVIRCTNEVSTSSTQARCTVWLLHFHVLGTQPQLNYINVVLQTFIGIWSSHSLTHTYTVMAMLHNIIQLHNIMCHGVTHEPIDFLCGGTTLLYAYIYMYI